MLARQSEIDQVVKKFAQNQDSLNRKMVAKYGMGFREAEEEEKRPDCLQVRRGLRINEPQGGEGRAEGKREGL